MTPLPPELAARIREPVPCGLGDKAGCREPCQLDWYALTAEICAGGTVLDVGAGLGGGLAYLQYLGIDAAGYDIDPQLASLPHMTVAPTLEVLADGSFDYAVCIDVLEHSTDPFGLLTELKRIARRWVLVSSPNYARDGIRNGAHALELTIPEVM